MEGPGTSRRTREGIAPRASRRPRHGRQPPGVPRTRRHHRRHRWQETAAILTHPDPDGRPLRISRWTPDRWIADWRRGGLTRWCPYGDRQLVARDQGSSAVGGRKLGDQHRGDRGGDSHGEPENEAPRDQRLECRCRRGDGAAGRGQQTRPHQEASSAVPGGEPPCCDTAQQRSHQQATDQRPMGQTCQSERVVQGPQSFVDSSDRISEQAAGCQADEQESAANHTLILMSWHTRDSPLRLLTGW